MNVRAAANHDCCEAPSMAESPVNEYLNSDA
jgi:hypothetical protein